MFFYILTVDTDTAPFDPSEVIHHLPSVLELHLKVTLTCHTQLGTHLPLHLAFPRLQCLQIEYDNESCSACVSLYGTFTGLTCVRRLVAPLLPHLRQLRMGRVKTKLVKDGVDCWQLDQLKRHIEAFLPVDMRTIVKN